jgi:dienelactone hydrolase
LPRLRAWIRWAAGRFLERQPGVTSVGVIGFSEGAQNTVLALAQTGTTVFDAGLTFSGPADQNAQIHSTAVPAGCETPNCSYPVTGALIALVVPPYTFNDPCAALAYAGTYYAVDPFDVLARECLPRADEHQDAAPEFLRGG